MARCLNCGRSGVFLSVDTNGICINCRPFLIYASENVRLIEESIEIVKNSRNLETRLSRCDFIIQKAEELKVYEGKGINIINPPPSVLIQNIKEARDSVIVESLRAETETALAKTQSGITTRTKLNVLGKLLLRVREYSKQCSTPNALSLIETQVRTLMNKIQLDAYLEAADKAELKGQKKKALDQYYEALYFLRHDEIDDAIQREQIASIETKIAELDGMVIEHSPNSTELAAISKKDSDTKSAGQTKPRSATTKCNQCGAENPDTYNFCGDCGTPLENLTH